MLGYQVKDVGRVYKEQYQVPKSHNEHFGKPIPPTVIDVSGANSVSDFLDALIYSIQVVGAVPQDSAVFIAASVVGQSMVLLNPEQGG